MDESHDIGWAMSYLRAGHMLRRVFWKNVDYIVLLDNAYVGHTRVEEMIMAFHRSRATPWTCSQPDLLAQDWKLFIPGTDQ